ncbi:MAG: type II toxin-antitoxin system Phd/YefM family antitoxin, partial [Rhodospirillaceae bacterium]|nr:type II toxin-antitoxin system Phd/YefM family antitoxin [Rhodospirillaceae bacterium]
MPARKWALQDAKAKFSALIDAVLAEGPQVVTRRGVDTAVVVPMAEWTRLSHAQQPTLKDLLLAAPKDAEFARRLRTRRAVRLPPPVALG